MQNKWFTAIGAILAALLLFFLLLLSGISIPLDFLDRRLESLAGSMLNREVHIHGPVRLKTSLQPSLQIDGLTISNPADWPQDSGNFLSLKHGVGQISLPDLLRGDIRINNLEFTGVALQLITHADGSSNYTFALDSDKKTAQTSEQSPASHELTGLDRVTLRDIQLSYHDGLSGTRYNLEIDEAHGQGEPDQALQFFLKGTIAQQPCILTVTGGTLHSLVEGRESWPLSEGKLTLGDIDLDLHGAVNRAESDLIGNISLAVQGDSLGAIGTIFSVPLPETGAFSLHGGISLEPGMVLFTPLQLDGLGSSLTGDLILSFAEEQATLAGNIHIGALDTSSFPGMAPEKPKEQKNTATAADSLEIPWQLLHAINSDLHIQVERLRAGEITIDNFKAVLSLFDGDLVSPLAFTIAGVPVDAHLQMLTSSATPSIELDLTGKSADLDPLMAALAKEQQLQGHLGDTSLQLSSRGKTLSDLLQELDIALRLGESSLNSSEMVLAATRSFSFRRSPGNPFTLSVEGDLFGSPLQIDSRIDPEARGKGDSPLLDLQLTACDTDLRLQATGKQGQQHGLDIHLQADGEQLCGLLSPVTQFLGGESNFSISTTGSIGDDGIGLDLEQFQLGDIVLDGKAALTAKNGKPKLMASVHSELIDLSPFFNSANGPTETQASAAGEQAALEQKVAGLKKLLSMEITPYKKLLSTDISLEVAVERLLTSRGKVTDIKLSALVEDGELHPSPFQAVIGGNTFLGSAAMDSSGAQPAINLQLATDHFTLQDLLTELQMDTAYDIRIGHVGLDLLFRGNTLQEMLQHSSYGVTIRDGQWQIDRDPALPLKLIIDEADFTSRPQQPAKLSVQGAINKQKLDIALLGSGLFAKGTTKPIHLDITTVLADTELHVDGRVNRSDSENNLMQLDTLLTGDTMSSLNELLGVNLPPFGPYSITGSLAIDQQFVMSLREMEMQVGTSTLSGEMVLSGSRDSKGGLDFPITTKTKLNAKTIQLDDFRLGEWSPVRNTVPEAAPDDETEKDQDAASLQNLLSVEMGGKVNGLLEIEVGQVLSGQDILGSGLLRASLKGGNYSLDTLHLDVPGGAIEINGALHPGQDSIRGELTMDVRHFDYGILARRIVPDSSLKGEINLNVDLYTLAPDQLQLKEHLNGQLRFGVVPEEFQAGIIDLWAVNIITAALPALMKGSSSTVNCLAGDFTLEDGIMHPEVFLLDTTNMRVEGKGKVDFRSNTIDFHMHPTPKSAHFFSLATPISVSGTIIEPEIGVTSASVVGTVFRQVTSVVTVPFQWLFTDNLEEDGSKACSAAMQWVHDSGKRE